MVNYTLTYCESRGLAEVIRQVFALAKHMYVDRRFTRDEWVAYKATNKAPFGQLPFLEFDGKTLAQSHSIARYLARQFGFAGKNPFDEAVTDSIADQVKDHINEVRPYSVVFMGFVQGDQAKLREELLIPAINKNFAAFTKFLKNSKSGFLVGESATWADLLLAQLTADLLGTDPELLDEFPEAKAHKEKVHGLPEIHHWIETRPNTKF